MTSIGEKYDDIANWWDAHHKNSEYGIKPFEKALSYSKGIGAALDIGCGTGGRFLNQLDARKFDITGIDASAEMIRIARRNHPRSQFIHADIRTWVAPKRYDFILAWDSLFHLPLDEQKPVLTKLCRWLKKGGILFYSFGDDVGEHQGETWRGHDFTYSSIGIAENIKLLIEAGLCPLHLERDQFPEKHAYAIAVKE